jgi:ribosomal protein S18 acetylase RimI-like enzyme
MSSSRPDGFTRRAARLEDAEAVYAVIAALDARFTGDHTWTVADVLDDWRDLELERDAWVWELDGRVAAYGALFTRPGHFDADGYVHPDFFGRGLGSAIVDATEARAAELGAPQVENAVLAADRRAVELLERRGYRETRRFYRMAISLDGQPPPPEWPEGIEVSTFDLAEARELHAAREEAFADEWNHVEEPFEHFERRVLQSERLDPTLWWVARDGGEIAGFLLAAWKMHGDAGWIASLGVRRPWRRRGLGLALLRQALGEFHRRGERVVQLGVDAESPTGATRLYERAGMHVAWEGILFEKALEP